MSDRLSLVGIRKWLIGEAMPETRRIGELAEIVQSTVEELLGNDVNISKHIKENAKTYGQVLPALRAFEVPIISWVQAGAFCNSETQVLPHDCEMILCPNKSASKQTFALRVVGDSMTAPHGRSYPEGTIIFVDPEKVASSGMRVIAKTEQGHTFKQLAENEFGQRYLKALNPHHQPIFDEGIEVCGVVIGSYTPE
ncbi:TPA: hypothetical protein RUZ39_001668 [Vibrio cholerae]|nr:hypothetical protein [Vibrio cholerae]